MQTGVSRALLTVLAVRCLVGCSPPEAAAAPTQHSAERDRDIQLEQRALEERRLQLQNQLLSELRKLRESRQASTGAAEPASEGAPEAAKLLIFGGVSHEVFLGCLCEEHDPESVFNMMGEFGSDSSSTSMRNKFAPYGSNYEDTSACNAAATHPPVVVASDGKSLGLLTMNTSLKRRIDAPSVTDWLNRVCGE